MSECQDVKVANNIALTFVYCWSLFVLQDLERERQARKEERERERVLREEEEKAARVGKIGAMFMNQAASRPKAKTKRKKLVERTRTSDDGYLVVEKVWVDCSDDEENAEPPQKPAPKPNKQQVKEAPQKKVQKRETKKTKKKAQTKRRLSKIFPLVMKR